MTFWTSRYLPIVATKPSVVVMTPPVVDRMGFTSSSFPESAELPFQPQPIRTGPTAVPRHSQVSPHLPGPLFLISSVLAAPLHSSNHCSFARPLSPHICHTTSYDVILTMSHELTPLPQASTMRDSSPNASLRCPIPSAESLRVKLHSLGADPYLPSRHIESFLRVSKQFACNIPRG